MKSYTDIEQSKKLAKILAIESADMYWQSNLNSSDRQYLLDMGEEEYFDIEMNFEHFNIGDYDVPAWSLASLISVLPFHLIVNNQRYAFGMYKGLNKYGETYKFSYNVFNTDVCLYSTDYYNNPIDACYEMISKLHELKLL